jgi:hypothetical protein
MTAVARGLPASLLVALVLAHPLHAQESKSAALAKELAAALDAAKLTSIAAKGASAEDVFVGALYFPGLQLLAISAKYTAPALLDQRLAARQYREIYVDLNSASDRSSRIIVTDLAVNGLVGDPSNQPPDSYDAAGKSLIFNGEWRDQKLTEEAYFKAFADADEQYARMLSALLAQLKGSS